MPTFESETNQSSLIKLYPVCAITVRAGNLSGMTVTVEPSGLKIGTDAPEKLLNDYAVLYRGTPGQDVAIQLFSPAHFENYHVREKFTQRITAQMALSHPNLIKIISFIEQDGFIYLVLEHFAGDSLDSILKKGALPIKKAETIFMKILDAFDYMHMRGFLYGEINPANIIISSDDIVKILPFGCIDMNRERKISDDIYHLGILFFELKTGLTRGQYSADHLKISQLMIDKAVPTGISEAISKAISENSAKRYKNAREFSEAIIAYSQKPEKTLTDNAANRYLNARQLSGAKSSGAISASDEKPQKQLVRKTALPKKHLRSSNMYKWIAPMILIAFTGLLIPTYSILQDKEEKPAPKLLDTKSIEAEKTVNKPEENPVEIIPQKPVEKVLIPKQESQARKLTPSHKKKIYAKKRIPKNKVKVISKPQGPPPQKTTNAKTAASSTIEKSTWIIRK